MSRLLIPAQNSRSVNIQVLQAIDPQTSIMQYTGLKVLLFHAAEEYSETFKHYEACIIALEGKISVYTPDKAFEQIGARQNIFDQNPTDSVFIPVGQPFSIKGTDSAKAAICYALATDASKEAVLIPAAENIVERRGNYSCKRLVNTMLSDASSISDKLLVTEVYTEGGNWSSYPPHKHDTDNLPAESLLEEIYYHEIDKEGGFVVQKVYTDDLLLDETYTVRNHDVVLVPKGYHPVGVPDGFRSYYLNVMAGPVKQWKFHMDKNFEFLLNRK